MAQKNDSPSRQQLDQLESQWLKEIAMGDRRAFENFYRAYHSRLLRFCHRITGQLNRLEEIVNDVMYVIWQKADTFDGTCRPSTWVFGIAYNKSLHALRLDKKDSLLVGLDAIPGEPACDGDSVNEYENTEWLNVAFAKLSTEQRTVMELTYFFGMSYQEIGNIMGCSENTVKTRMFYARKKLQKILPGLAGQPSGEP